MMTLVTQSVGRRCGSAVVTWLAVLASAQAQEPVQLQRVEVTGSAIKRAEGESALPVSIIRRDDIERSGATSAAELVDRISANNTRGFNAAEAIADENNPRGFAGASLRGLGSNRTLILLNGRRLANYAFGATGTPSNGAVDLNSIPLAAVERVEVLRDGASALYGTDAIGGVINFILRRDFRGADVSAYNGNSEAGGGRRQRATLAGGLGDLQSDRYNVFAFVDYQKNGSIAARHRDFSRSALIIRPDGIVNNTSGNAFPANILDPGIGFVNPTAATGCVPPSSFRFPADSASCRFDYLNGIDIVNPSEKLAAVLRGAAQLTPEQQVYAEITYSHNRFRFEIAPSAFSSALSPYLYPAGGKYYPGLGITPPIPGLTPGDLNIFYRSVELGPRTSDVVADAVRGVVGFAGTVSRWDYDVGLLFSSSKADDVRTSGYANEDLLRAALLTGEINPFGPSDAAGLALLKSTQEHLRRTSTGTVVGADARFSGEVYRLPAGPLALAVGAELRREKLDDVVGFVTRQSVTGRRDVRALYVEASVPVTRRFEMTLSARHDRYSDFGAITNPKVALRWQPARSLVARASYGKGFRAPSLYDLYTQQTLGVTPFFSDPVRCPVTGLPTDCSFNFQARGGGNPNLKPESSRQASLGLVFTPASDVFASIDYWRIHTSNSIGTLSSSAVFDNFAKYDANGTVRRTPGTDPAFPGLPNPISGIDLFTTNLGSLRTDGVDVEAAYRGPPTKSGRFGVNLRGTYVRRFQSQFEEGGAIVENAGRFVNGYPVIRWRHSLAMTWDTGPWRMTLAQNYQGGYEDFLDSSPGLGQTPRRVGHDETYDVQVAYAGSKNLKLAFGVKNLFDRSPPYTRQVETFQIGYDPRLSDPTGRFLYATLGYSFK